MICKIIVVTIIGKKRNYTLTDMATIKESWTHVDFVIRMIKQGNYDM